MHYRSKKKKIRGWKRHIRKIERWKRHAMAFPFDELHAHKRTYVKLTIHPFYFSFEGKLPAWFVREVFDAVLDVYHSWHEQLQSLHEPYDLMVLLFEPDFMKSQVVVSYRDCLHFYDQTFEQREQQRAFPTEKFVNDPMKVNYMSWQLYIHTTDWTKEIIDGWLEDDLITRQELDCYKQNVYKTMVLSNGDLLYLIDSGNVWIGKHTQEDEGFMQVIQLTEKNERFNEAIDLYWKTWGEEGGKVFYEDAMVHSLQDTSGLPSFYIAIDDREFIIGTYALLRNDLNSRQDLRPWLACLYVSEDHRGQQLGAKLLEHGLKEAAKRGYGSLYLTSDLEGYYEKYGWKQIALAYGPSGGSIPLYENHTNQYV